MRWTLTLSVLCGGGKLTRKSPCVFDSLFLTVLLRSLSSLNKKMPGVDRVALCTAPPVSTELHFAKLTT